MSKKNIVIVDYGLGNLLSVFNAFKYLGAGSSVEDRPEKLKQADAVVLPGVGAFADGMMGLKKRNFIEPLKEFILTGRPFLGICLGAQLLMTKGFEFGEHAGLNFIDGEVVSFGRHAGSGKKGIKIPHIGWNGLLKGTKGWDGTILSDVKEGQEMYFVHSFFVAPQDRRHILAETQYGEERFCSVVAKDNVYGCQFHPEKSSTFGLKILGNFVRLMQ